MAKSVFNIDFQQQDLTSKIAAGLERVSEAFRVLLWEHAKHIGLSPIQIQILIFIKYHKEELCTVSQLAQEFNVTKPTISDAVKALDNKDLIIKIPGSTDSRTYSISLSKDGKKLVRSVEGFAFPIKKHLDSLEIQEQEDLFQTITKLIYKLNQAGTITVQRTCFGCKFYEKATSGHYCNLLQSDISNNDIRIDCPEFEAKI